ncbi:MAG: hypothetical protein E6G77_20740 [Alphaproteobacteria bacterium]|nr:MAG: hypothetical protein E6G77_20740 [Alphaproteobacteria bacterium]
MVPRNPSRDRRQYSRRTRASQRDLDLAAQPAQAEREHGLPQLRRRADVAAPLVEGDAHLQPLVTHWYLAHPA